MLLGKIYDHWVCSADLTQMKYPEIWTCSLFDEDEDHRVDRVDGSGHAKLLRITELNHLPKIIATASRPATIPQPVVK